MDHDSLVVEKDGLPSAVGDDAPIFGPWEQVSLDLRKFPDGRTMAIMIDMFLQFPIIEAIEPMTVQGVRGMLEKTFTKIGTPVVLDCKEVAPQSNRAVRGYLPSV